MISFWIHSIIISKYLSNTNEYVNLMCITLVLQTCKDPLYILPDSSGESHATSSDGACIVSKIKVEKVIDVKEEDFIPVNEEVDIDIKQAVIREDVNILDTKAEPDEVSYVCVCLLLDIFYQFPATSVVILMSVFLAT